MRLTQQGRGGRRGAARPLGWRAPRAGTAVSGVLAAAALAAALLGCEDMGDVVQDQPPGPQCAPVSFTNDVEPLLNSSCTFAGCHSPPVYAGGMDLRTGSSYTSLTTRFDGVYQLKVVEPGDLERSMLYQRLEGNTEFGVPMPQPPRPALPQDQRQLVYCWILDGAQQN